VLVVVAVVAGMPMPVMGVVHVIAVPDGLVPAARPVLVPVLVVGDVRQRVLVVVAVVRGVRVALVHVVSVILVRRAGVAAAGSVVVSMPGMGVVPPGVHSLSPAC
jgi:hypothetical protein